MAKKIGDKSPSASPAAPLRPAPPIVTGSPIASTGIVLGGFAVEVFETPRLDEDGGDDE